MSEEKLESSNESKVSRSARAPRKPKTGQIPQAIVVSIIIIIIGYFLYANNIKMGCFWLMGIGFGYVLQRSRFCFTAAFRDPWITGSTTLTRAVLLAFALGSLGVIGIKYGAILSGAKTNFNMIDVNPIGLPLALGGIIFGIGMVIAGGCASGTLMRVGEGFIMQCLSLLFFIIGTVWGVHDVGIFWSKFNTHAPKVFLPDVFGWFGAVVVQGLIIVLLYIAAVKWQEKKMGKAD